MRRRCPSTCPSTSAAPAAHGNRRVERHHVDSAGAGQEALRLATEDAKQRAQFLARQFDARSGRVFSIHHGPRQDRPAYAALMERGCGVEPAFELGTIEVKAQVDVTFYLDREPRP